MSKHKRRKREKNVDNNDNLPLQEITPDEEEERRRRDQEVVIRQKILDEMREKDTENTGTDRGKTNSNRTAKEAIN